MLVQWFLCQGGRGPDFIWLGNDGSLKVAKLMGDDIGAFNKVPGEMARLSDKKLDFSRILSLDIQNVGKDEILVKTRHRWGSLALVKQLTRGKRCRGCRESPAVRDWLALPSCLGII